MRATSYSKRSITIEGSEEEVNAITRMLAGVCYVACGRDGMPLLAEKFQDVIPLPDPQLAQHFTPAPATVAKFTREKTPDLSFDANDDMCCSIFVEHICGYDYTPAEYSRRAAQLEAMGFVCMRSPRGKDGRYWESWYLPGLWAGDGMLKGIKSVSAALNILAREIRPGSISAVRQRMALVID